MDRSNVQKYRHPTPRQDLQILHLNTRDKVSGDNNCAVYDLNTSHIFEKESWMSIALYNIEMAHAFYPISSTRKNSTIYWTDNSGSYSATIADNNYSGAQIATALTTAMDAASARTFTITYDTQSHKLTFAPNAGTLSIDSGANNINDEIGVLSTQAAAASYVCAYPVALQGTAYIDIFINAFAHSNFSTSVFTGPVIRVPLDVNFGEVMTKFGNLGHVRIHTRHIGHIQVDLRDDKGYLIDMPANHPVSLSFSIIYEHR